MFEQNPGICGGRVVIRGTRIPVDTIVELHRQGADIIELLDTFPSLTKKQIKTILNLAHLKPTR